MNSNKLTTAHLLNSSIMPEPGVYELHMLNEHEFAVWVKVADKYGRLKSYIGYPQTAKHIQKLSGIKVAVSREPVVGLADGDVLLICKLKYRIKDPATKGSKVDETEFEYMIAYYTHEKGEAK